MELKKVIKNIEIEPWGSQRLDSDLQTEVTEAYSSKSGRGLYVKQILSYILLPPIQTLCRKLDPYGLLKGWTLVVLLPYIVPEPVAPIWSKPQEFCLTATMSRSKAPMRLGTSFKSTKSLVLPPLVW